MAELTVLFMLTRSIISDTSVQVITAVAIKNSIGMNDVRSESAYLRPFWGERNSMLAYYDYLSSFFVILDTFLNLTILPHTMRGWFWVTFQISLQRS